MLRLDDERFEALECFAGQSSVVQLLEKAQQIGAIPADRDLHNETLMYERIAHYQKALQLYQVPPLPVEIHQFYAAEPFLSRRARAAKTSIGPGANSPMGVGPGFKRAGHSCPAHSRQPHDDDDCSRERPSSGPILISGLKQLTNNG
ncbi:hypothetical protein GWE18_40450 [Bradyrhizobium sp. CSA112]|uniref:hypothetical protein n=1 Tax=Bradyrhizobium sp. CSA112 TaxID=2699170 RepID=UPI0023AF14B5|nr:hypothetical protein [Bradyrhizobium sp. CSA112]MDE5458895.1 hypothetical protein [Bradyrhizobium sp. CSA112]